jgi:hypothetical protein
MKTLLIALIGLLAFAPARTARAQGDKPADVNGAWALEVEIPGGGTATPTVTFKQDGEKLTGVYSSQVLGEQQITGMVKGNQVTFGFEATFDGNKVKIEYKGTVDKDTMKGTAAFGDMGEGSFTAKKK